MIKTERKNKKKKKQATTKPPGESFSIDSPSLEKPLVIDSMAGRGGEGNRPPRRTLGDYAYQQGPKHYNNIVIPPFNNKVVELKSALLSFLDIFKWLHTFQKHTKSIKEFIYTRT